MYLKGLVKILLSLILAFFISQLFVEGVIFPYVPVVRPSFKIFLANLPLTLKRTPEKLLTRNPDLPPPWKKKPLFPQNPPFFYPPTAIPTAPPFLSPTPWPTPTLTQLPPSATPTWFPGAPSLTPTRIPTSTPVSAYPTATPPPSDCPDGPLKPEAGTLLDLINNERQKQGTRILVFECHLNRAAQDYANIMTSCTHIGPDGSDPTTRMRRAGYPGSYGGENIACGASSPQRVFQMWMASSGHKANMLDPSWKSAGIGYSRGYWVLDLGPI